jgi:hypothetical protein
MVTRNYISIIEESKLDHKKRSLYKYRLYILEEHHMQIRAKKKTYYRSIFRPAQDLC